MALILRNVFTELYEHEAKMHTKHRGLAYALAIGIPVCLIVIGLVIWGLLWPKHRQRHPGKPSRTRFNDGFDSGNRLEDQSSRGHLMEAVNPLDQNPRRRAERYNQFWPTHPGVLPDNLRMCGPEVKNPLSARIGPPRPKSIALERVVPLEGFRSQSGTDNKGIIDTRRNILTETHHTYARHKTQASSDYGDAKDYILSIPEPLKLKQRSDERPVAVTTFLKNIQSPVAIIPMSTSKHEHPNKLFRQINAQNLRSSECSTTSMRVDHRVSDAVVAVAAAHVLTAQEVLDLVAEAIADGDDSKSLVADSESSDELYKLKEHITGESNQNERRLQAYRSLVGDEFYQQRLQPLQRAGTKTRPKTPVTETRKIYEKPEREEMPEISRCGNTLSTFAMADSSDVHSTSTSATSPGQQSAGSADMFPKHIDFPLRQQSIIAAVGKAGSDEQVNSSGNERQYTGAACFSAKSRRSDRPAPLKVIGIGSHRRSLVSKASTVLSPLMRRRPASLPSSSIYSTAGETPISPFFPLPLQIIASEPSRDDKETRAMSPYFTSASSDDAAPQPSESFIASLEECTDEIRKMSTSPTPEMKQALARLGEGIGIEQRTGGGKTWKVIKGEVVGDGLYQDWI